MPPVNMGRMSPDYMEHPPAAPEPPAWVEGMRWSSLLSILGPVAWRSVTLLYVAFWAQGFSLFQQVVVILVSLLILGGVMGSAWTVWGTGRGRRYWRT